MLFNSILFLTISCGESSDKSTNKTYSDSSLEEKSTSESSGNCLDKYYGNPEELLTQDLVGEFVDFEAGSGAVNPIDAIVGRQRIDHRRRAPLAEGLIALKAADTIRMPDDQQSKFW